MATESQNVKIRLADPKGRFKILPSGPHTLAEIRMMAREFLVISDIREAGVPNFDGSEYADKKMAEGLQLRAGCDVSIAGGILSETEWNDHIRRHVSDQNEAELCVQVKWSETR